MASRSRCIAEDNPAYVPVRRMTLVSCASDSSTSDVSVCGSSAVRLAMCLVGCIAATTLGPALHRKRCGDDVGLDCSPPPTNAIHSGVLSLPLIDVYLDYLRQGDQRLSINDKCPAPECGLGVSTELPDECWIRAKEPDDL